MQRVYDEVKTPFKYGIVLAAGRRTRAVDCPNVFRFGDKWYMVYVRSRTRSATKRCLAESDDLLELETARQDPAVCRRGLGQVAGRRQHRAGRSDVGRLGRAAAVRRQILDVVLRRREARLRNRSAVDRHGVDHDARTKPSPWTRLAENPVLAPSRPDARPFEQATLYKSHILWDKSESLGYPFVMFYNGKQQGRGIERIGMAVSNDMVHWTRYGDGAGDRQRQRHLGRSADRADGRPVGDVLLRRVLEAGGVRHVRLLARPGALDEVGRASI